MSRSPPCSRVGATIYVSVSLIALIVGTWSLRRNLSRGTIETISRDSPIAAQAAQPKPLSRADQAMVRVAVTSSPDKRIELSIDGPYQFRPVGNDKVLSRGERLSATTVTA